MAKGCTMKCCCALKDILYLKLSLQFIRFFVNTVCRCSSDRVKLVGYGPKILNK